MNIYATQPRFLPWIGFWNQVLCCDRLVFMCGVQFDQREYQHRVRLQGSWLTLPVQQHSSRKLIKEVRVADVESLPRMAMKLRKALSGKKYPYADRLEPVFQEMEGQRRSYLADVNVALFGAVMRVLDFNTPFYIDGDPREGMTAIEKLTQIVTLYGSGQVSLDRYLMGSGALEYMPNGLPGIRTMVQELKPDAPDGTILEVIASEAKPRDVVALVADWRRVTDGSGT